MSKFQLVVFSVDEPLVRCFGYRVIEAEDPFEAAEVVMEDYDNLHFISREVQEGDDLDAIFTEMLMDASDNRRVRLDVQPSFLPHRAG